MSKVFISGTAGFGTGKKLTSLPQPVMDMLTKSIYDGDEILVGDCQGVDTLVQEVLKRAKYPNVTVYCSGSTCRNVLDSSWSVKHIQVPRGYTGRAFYAVKDNAMAIAADSGIAIWDGKSVGTGNNIKNLTFRGKTVTVFRTDLNEIEYHQPKTLGE